MNIYSIVLALIVSQAVTILSAIFVNFSRKKLALTFLGYIFVTLLCASVICYYFLVDGPKILLKLRGFFNLNLVSLGPMLYLYLKAEMEPGFKLKKSHWVHVIPFAISLFMIFPVLFLTEEQVATEMFDGKLFGPRILVRSFTLLSLSFYIYLSLRFLRVYHVVMESVSASENVVNLRWAYLLIYIIIGVTAIAFFITIKGVTHVTMSFAFITLVIIFYVTAIFNHIHSRLFEKFAEETKSLKEKYSSSPFDSGQVEDYAQRIRNIVDQKSEVFYDPGFKLSNLSKMLGIPNYLTSQVINEGMNKNFYDLVNEQRIIRARQMLKDPETADKPIIDVAYSVGYNSKSTFNQAFKKYTGVTPSQYRKS